MAIDRTRTENARRFRLAEPVLAVLAVVALVALGACGADDGSDPGATRINLVVVGGKVEGGVRQVKASLGDRVTISVMSDVADEVHVHGYDLTAEVRPGQPGKLAFTADIPGVFETELHEAGRPLLELEVS